MLRRTPRPVILTGGRGVGKTLLLGEAAVIAAEKHSWLTVPIEVRPGRPFTPQLLERLGAARDLYRQTPGGKHLEVTTAKIRTTVRLVFRCDRWRPFVGQSLPCVCQWPLVSALAHCRA